jgi:spermidine/putrescine transport system permease protein
MSEGATQPWRSARGVFAILASPPVLWLLLFFAAPLAIIWTYSFG